ncbi:unnamed protein product [Penicillium manginii]
MAEALTVVGAVASFIQLVDFTTKVCERVNHYIHRVDEAPGNLRDVAIYLPLFIDSLRRTQFHIDFGHFNPQTSSALKILIDECFSQMNELDDLMTKLAPEQGDSKLTKTRKAILSLKDEKTLERIFSKVKGYIEMLLLYQNSVTSTHTMANTKLVLKQIEKAAARIDFESVTAGALVVDSQSISTRSSTQSAGSRGLANYSKRNKQRRISYFMGLTRFGLLWAFQADLDLSWGNYGFSISPSLHFQQLVKNTSPGYQILSLVARWNKSGIHLELLKELLASGYDCSIDSTVDRLRWKPSKWNNMETQDGNAHDGFCYYRPYNDRDGKSQCEPFLLKFLVECSKNSYGVWGQTPLMDRILCGSEPEISSLLGHPQFLRGRNCLGQTATHVAVLRPDVLSMLLQFDVADIDGADFCGNSPLVYAAAYGYTDSVIELLKAGADPLEGGHLKFLHWAFFWNHRDVAKETFSFFRATARFSAPFLKGELHYFMEKEIYPSLCWRQFFWGSSPEFLEMMLTLGVDKHILFEDGSTLLHYAKDPKWINSLFNAGFQKIDHRNNEGETALMKFIPAENRLVRHALIRNCSVNYRNNRGQTPLHKAFANSPYPTYWIDNNTATYKSHYLWSISNNFATIARLLDHGADTSIHDNCRCPCAPDGCSPFRPLIGLLGLGKSRAYIWIMECLLMLIDFQGQTIAQKALFEIKRVREFELADMTHVCCNRGSFYPREPMDDAEVDEIIDEEKEFVALLEKKMRDPATTPDKISIEESWLSLISDFGILDEPFRRMTFWELCDPDSTMCSHDLSSLKLKNKPGPVSSKGLNITRVEEGEDKYWQLAETTEGHEMPSSSIYCDWVEWVYENPHEYYYPFPIDRNWYERRKYWATRQAEVLDGLS